MCGLESFIRQLEPIITGAHNSFTSHLSTTLSCQWRSLGGQAEQGMRAFAPMTTRKWTHGPQHSRLSFEMEGRLSVLFSSSHSHAVPAWYRCAQVTAGSSIEYARSYPQFPAYSLVSAVAEPQQGTEETDLSEGVARRHTAGVLVGWRICTLGSSRLWVRIQYSTSS